MSDLVLENVSYRYGAAVVAVHQLSLAIERGEFFALLGPSGSGKTTILRLIAGFITPQEGRILIDGEDVLHLPVHRRQIGFVFQNFALFPHMTVEQNIAFGLQSQHVPQRVVRERIGDALSMVQLAGMEKRRPAQLSGGQQQRVAFARAMVIEPHVLLLDEPLASLDRKLRVEMQVELRQLQQRLKITTIFVTHDQEEALTLADRIAVMKAGRIEQVGQPLAVYTRPRTRFIAEFLGLSNIISGEIVGSEGDYARIRTQAGWNIQAQPNDQYKIGDTVQVMVRPEQMQIVQELPRSRLQNTVKAFIGHISFTGASLTYHLYTEDNLALTVFEQSRMGAIPPALGSSVIVTWSPDSTFILDEETAATGIR